MFLLYLTADFEGYENQRYLHQRSTNLSLKKMNNWKNILVKNKSYFKTKIYVNDTEYCIQPKQNLIIEFYNPKHLYLKSIYGSKIQKTDISNFTENDIELSIVHGLFEKNSLFLLVYFLFLTLLIGFGFEKLDYRFLLFFVLIFILPFLNKSLILHEF